jgi:hypothetical protein
MVDVVVVAAAEAVVDVVAVVFDEQRLYQTVVRI